MTAHRFYFKIKIMPSSTRQEIFFSWIRPGLASHVRNQFNHLVFLGLAMRLWRTQAYYSSRTYALFG